MEREFSIRSTGSELEVYPKVSSGIFAFLVISNCNHGNGLRWILLVVGFSFLLIISPTIAETPKVLVEIQGIQDTSLKESLESLSPLCWQGLRGKPSESLLRARCQQHRQRLKEALFAEGYCEANVDFSLEYGTKTPRAVFSIDTGPAYQIETIKLTFYESPNGAELSPEVLPEDFNFEQKQGILARFETVLETEEALVEQLKTLGFPFAKLSDRQVYVNHDLRTISTQLSVVLGPRVKFGKVQLVGLRNVLPDTVLRHVAWFEGAWYDERLLRKTQAKLQQSGLFTLVQVYLAEEDNVSHDQIPIYIEVAERLHRTISLGIEYRSDEGIGASGQWEHRNFMNLGRRLRLQSNLSELEQNISISYEIPEFIQSKDTLTLSVKAAQIDPDPYMSRRLDIGAWLEHPISSKVSWGMGPALRISQVEDQQQLAHYYLLSFPVQLTLDHRDDRMNPQEGFRIINRATPFLDIRHLQSNFLKNEFFVSYFLPLGSDITLATRLRLGVATGASLGDIPADERLYAGGGGSIRGYTYQTVGPLDRQGKPSGGRSLIDMSFELRKRFSEQFGATVFLDGGMAYKTPYFDFSDPLQWGAGVGVRYFTPIGPLRLDVAVPLNRRKGIDSSVQFYLSIGQAF